jgi:hypothetical protein
MKQLMWLLVIFDPKCALLFKKLVIFKVYINCIYIILYIYSLCYAIDTNTDMNASICKRIRIRIKNKK